MSAQQIIDGYFEWLGDDTAAEGDGPDVRRVLHAWKEMKVERARLGFQLRKAIRMRRETQMRAIADEGRRQEQEVAVVNLSGKIYPGREGWNEFMEQSVCAGERLRARGTSNIEH